MCAVSAVIDTHRGQWPLPWQVPPMVYGPYLEAVKLASAEDVANGTPFCSTPEKAQWQKDLEILIRKQYK